MSRSFLTRPQGSAVGVPYPICTLSARAPPGMHFTGIPGSWAGFGGQGPPPLVNNLSAQVLRTC